MAEVNKSSTGDIMVQPKATHKISTEIRTELDSLEKTLERVRSKLVGEWSQVDSFIAADIQQHVDTMNKNEEMITNLHETYKQLENQESNKRKMSEDQAEEIKRVKTEIDRVKKETDALLRQKEQQEQLVADLRQKNNQYREAIENEEKSTAQATQELEKAAVFFKDRLGLSMKKVSGDRLQFVFTSIDQKDPSRPFYFCVRIKPDRTYEVTDCEPRVSDLEQMITRLNATNNFRSFVIAMRKCFKIML